MTNMLTNYLDLIKPIYGVPYYECIVWHDGKILYQYKSEDLMKSGKDMYFAYSISKPITCVGALRLVENAKLKLDDKLSKYLPEYEKMYVLKDGKRIEAKKEITIENLFSMSAGLNYNIEAPSILKAKSEHPNASTREIIKALANEPLDFEPSSKYCYSLCHDVLGAVVEEVSGMRFGEYQKKYIFDPLCMTDTSYGLPDDKKDRLVPKLKYTFDKGFESMKQENMYFLTPRFESGGAGVVTTANDYIKFASTLANGGVSQDGYNLLKSETIDDMKKNRMTPDMVRDGYLRKYLQGYGYGLGVRTMIDRTQRCTAAPVGEFGWSGAAGAYTMIDTENKLAVYYGQHVYSMVRIAEEVHPMLRELAYKII